MTMSVGELSAREEIRQTVYRYFRAVDRLDLELSRSTYWHNAVFNGGPTDLPLAEVVPQMFAEMSDLLTSNHYIMNIAIDVQGSSAVTEAYAIAYHVVRRGTQPQKVMLGDLIPTETQVGFADRHEFIMGLRYLILFEERNREWRVGVLKIIVDWSKVTPYSGLSQGGIHDLLTLRGSRDRSDPSYDCCRMPSLRPEASPE
jgi:hypothetical protein